MDFVIDRDLEDTLYHNIPSDDDQNCDSSNQRKHTDIHRLLIEFHIAEVHDRHFQLIFLGNLPAAGSQLCFIHLLLILKMYIGTIISGIIAAPSFQGFFGKKDGRSIYLFFFIAFQNASYRIFSVKTLAVQHNLFTNPGICTVVGKEITAHRHLILLLGQTALQQLHLVTGNIHRFLITINVGGVISLLGRFHS